MKGDLFVVISADRTWPYGLSSFSSFLQESGPIRVRIVVWGRKRKKLASVIVGLFALEKRQLKNRSCFNAKEAWI